MRSAILVFHWWRAAFHKAVALYTTPHDGTFLPQIARAIGIPTSNSRGPWLRLWQRVWCHGGVPCHGGMLFSGAMPWWDAILGCCAIPVIKLPLLNAIAGCHGRVPLLNAIAGCHGGMPLLGAMVGCHFWVPWWSAVAGCHSWLPWWDAIVENTKIGLCYLGSMLEYFFSAQKMHQAVQNPIYVLSFQPTQGGLES